MMKKTLLMLAALVLALTSGANDAYPPEIAKWTEADLVAQRTRTVKLMRDFQTAVKAGAGKFVIPPGDYRFDEQPTRNFFLQDVRDLEIDASGATFWVDGRRRIDLVSMRRCRNVKLSNLTVDYYPLGHSQGRVTKLDPAAKSLEIELAPGFPEPVLPLWLERPGQVKAIFFDEKTTRMLPTRLDWVSRLEPLGSRRYRAEIRNNSPFVDPGIVKEGDTLVLPYRGYRQAVALVDCSGITLENVTVYGSGQMAFTEEGGEGGNAYRRCRVVRRPGTKRLIVCSADIFHSTKVAKGPLIEECEFSWGCDDLINIHGMFSLVSRQTAPDEVLAASIIAPEKFEGEKLRFYTFGSLAPKGSATVVSAVLEKDPAVRADAAKLPGEMEAAGMRSAGFYGREFFLYRLKFDAPVKLGRYDLLESFGHSGNGARIVNNYFHDGFTRGILCRGDGVTIENNRIERMMMSGLYMASENYFLEGAGPSNVSIRNNEFREVCMSMQGRKHHLEGAAILVYSAAADWHTARGVQLCRDIAIENNRIVTAGTFGIFLANTDGGRIVGNTIDGAFFEAIPPDADRLIRANAAAIYLTESKNVEVSGNRISNSGPDVKAPVLYGPGTMDCGPQK